MAQHGGVLPADLPGLLALPGIGPYTARAILAFAHESDGVGVLDTNAARVLARWTGRRLGRPRRPRRRRRRRAAPGRGWAWNQAMLDLGATVCRARTPSCDACPVAGADPPAPGASPATPSPIRPSARRASPAASRRFEGSDRQGWGTPGRPSLRRRRWPRSTWLVGAGWPDDLARAERVAASLVTDGLAVARRVAEQAARWRVDAAGGDGCGRLRRRPTAPNLQRETDQNATPRPHTTFARGGVRWVRSGGDEVDDEAVDHVGVLEVEEVAAVGDHLEREPSTGSSARISSVTNSDPMQPSSTPWRYSVGIGIGAPPADSTASYSGDRAPLPSVAR